MVVAIIQARMTSTRLPGKVLADLNGVPLLAYLLDRLSTSRTLSQTLVATTTNKADDQVADLCRTLGVEVFRGSENDVLQRYRDAAVSYEADTIVRLTADCPMTDPHLVDQIVGAYLGSGVDYLSNAVERSYPDGLDVEVFGRTALEVAHERANSGHDREHVTPFIYRDGTDQGLFRVAHHRFVADFAHLRWTVDTERDLERVRRLTSQLPRGYCWLDALAVATKDPELLGYQV